MRFGLKSALGLVAAVVALLPGAALAHVGGFDLPAVTPSYVATLRIGPPGRTIAVDAPVELPSGPANVVLCTTDADDMTPAGFEKGTRHVALHVVDRGGWNVIDNATVTLELRNTVTGLTAALPGTRMLDPTYGVRDVHYGGDVLMPDGRYQVRASVNGEAADFELVVRAGQVETPPDAWTVLFGRGAAPGLLLLFGLGGLVVLFKSLTGAWAPADALRARQLFLVLLLFQGLHEFEHVVQVVQAFVLGQRGAAGLLGSALGLEPVHFAYNAWFLALVGATFASVGLRRQTPIGRAGAVALLLGAATLLQTYHVVEHVAKIAQYLSTGQNGMPGLLGLRFNPIWLHFVLNTAAYAPCLLAFALSGLHRSLIDDTRRLFGGTTGEPTRAASVGGLR
jgi:hypothetical protein